MPNLSRRTFTALGWQGATQAVTQALQFSASVALAHLLGPREFGLVGMVWVFTGFASVVSDMGLGAAIIQRRELSAAHLSSAFWMNVGVASLLTTALIVAAPLVAWFYHEPQLRALTAVVSFNFILTAPCIVQLSLLDRSLDFRTTFWIEIGAVLSSGTLAVFMAWSGAGVWSIVSQSLVYASVRFALTWTLSKWRPSWSFDPRALRELFGYSRNLMGFSLVNYWGRNADRLVLGRLMGSTTLGAYNVAFRLIGLPLDITTNVTNSVMFPALSSIQGDQEMMGRVYLRSTRLIALATFPLMIGLAILAEPAVLLVLGDHWRASIGAIRLLALAGMAQSVYNTSTWLFLSRGRTDIMLWLGVYSAVLRAGGAAAGAPWGINGVAWGYVVGTAFLWYPVWRNAGRLVDLRFLRLLRNLQGPFVCAVGMGSAVWICDYWLAGRSAPAMRVTIGVLLGIALYTTLMRQFDPEAWNDVRRAMIEMGAGRFSVLRGLLGNESRTRLRERGVD